MTPMTYTQAAIIMRQYNDWRHQKGKSPSWSKIDAAMEVAIEALEIKSDGTPDSEEARRLKQARERLENLIKELL